MVFYNNWPPYALQLHCCCLINLIRAIDMKTETCKGPLDLTMNIVPLSISGLCLGWPITVTFTLVKNLKSQKSLNSLIRMTFLINWRKKHLFAMLWAHLGMIKCKNFCHHIKWMCNLILQFFVCVNVIKRMQHHMFLIDHLLEQLLF